MNGVREAEGEGDEGEKPDGESKKRIGGGRVHSTTIILSLTPWFQCKVFVGDDNNTHNDEY